MEMIFAKTPEMVRTRNLGANTCLQLTTSLDVEIGSSGSSVSLADSGARHSATIQSVQTR